MMRQAIWTGNEEEVLMTRSFRIAIIVVIVLVVILVGGYTIYNAFLGKPSTSAEHEYEWTTMDENYTPKDSVEEYILNDAEARGTLPVSIINYGDDESVLRRFRGSRFAGPTEAQLKMMFKGMEDWKLIDIKYKDDKDREIIRTVLYIYINGEWSVGDGGQLTK
jgi:hypothetical protein